MCIPATLTVLYAEESSYPYAAFCVLRRWQTEDPQHHALIADYGLHGFKPGATDVQHTMEPFNPKMPDYLAIREAIARFDKAIENHVLFIEQKQAKGRVGPIHESAKPTPEPSK